jgi:F-type H+-transporting ATPase subunit b
VLIDWFTIIAQIINFLILVLLLRRFLYGPILRAMEEREAKIAARLQEAARREQEAEQETKTWRQKNQELETMREDLLRKAGQDAEDWRQNLIRKARQEVSDVRARWQQSLEQEQEALLAEIRKRTIRQVHAIARRALSDLANADLEHHLVEVFIRRLGEDGRAEVTDALRQAQKPLVVRTAFASPPDMRHTLRAAVQDRIGGEVDVRFETIPDLICGIELQADDYKIAWSLDDYLASLEEDLIQALGQGANPNGHETTTTDNSPG